MSVSVREWVVLLCTIVTTVVAVLSYQALQQPDEVSGDLTYEAKAKCTEASTKQICLLSVAIANATSKVAEQIQIEVPEHEHLSDVSSLRPYEIVAKGKFKIVNLPPVMPKEEFTISLVYTVEKSWKFEDWQLRTMDIYSRDRKVTYKATVEPQAYQPDTVWDLLVEGLIVIGVSLLGIFLLLLGIVLLTPEPVRLKQLLKTARTSKQQGEAAREQFRAGYRAYRAAQLK